MNKIKLSLILAFLSLSLLACNDKPKPTPTEEVYNFRDEKYQDFYSVFMRKVQQMDKDSINPNDGFEMSFDYQKIKQVLDIEHPNQNILFKLNINRVNPNDRHVGMPAKYQDKEDILTHRQQQQINFKYQECSLEKQIDGLYCLDTKQLSYYYLPNESKYKIKNINQSIDADCSLNCWVLNYPTYPYNVRISIHFSNPQDFLYIINYVEKYFFKMTGEHIWQRSLNQK
ncbi:hypothetical protein [Moraxella sp. ZY210820]|uniref:hypothetical protein n=1 Tax=unclassified Moraxella TaxID=2685852 RepID=UPI002731E8E3|nr:hypothetical protein [Moraxella sp. ZY210820]WLF84384.1 hypothetical protein LU301_02540 [Moraxella sp. ZY210820]